MICSRCGARVTNDKRFCGDCGSPLPWQCNACGSENPPGKRFCADCGAAQGAAVSSTSGQVSQAAERRQLTIVFVDLVNSTRLSTQLDPEDLRAVMATYHHCVTGLVGRFGGIIARY